MIDGLSVRMSVSLSVREHISGTAGRIGTEFRMQIPVAVALSSSGSIAVCYVLPVLWIMSPLAVVGRMTMHGLSVMKYSAPRRVARPQQSLMSMNALFMFVLHLPLHGDTHEDVVCISVSCHE